MIKVNFIGDIILMENEGNIRENVVIDIDGSSNTTVNDNYISRYEVGISGRNTRELNAFGNVIKINEIPDEDIEFIKDDLERELQNVKEVLKQIESGKSTNVSEKISERLTPFGLKIFEGYLKANGYIK